MRAHRGRPRPTVLLAGDAVDLRDLRALVSTLPGDAYGQVYIEVTSPEQVVPLPTPARVVVTWLQRDEADAAGAMLAAAIDGWIAEWMPAGRCDHGRIAWIGCSSAPRIAERYRVLQERSMTAPAMGLPAVGTDDLPG
ncbi:SIP domain-containing protein [uncultured Amnibacterium sp.]|uniref:SIP domain-containing protein n=1 Tax=uncultured Amnibacterium sp. TaxID=1631851 RepID=UPI0035CC7A89